MTQSEREFIACDSAPVAREVTDILERHLRKGLLVSAPNAKVWALLQDLRSALIENEQAATVQTSRAA